MNSSSVPTYARMPAPSRRASCRRRICRGEATTSLPSSHCRSAISETVPGCQGTRRNVAMSGIITKSPYPRSHELMA